VFFDAGALSSHRWQFGPFYYSAGIGARLQVFGNGSPPLMIGYGWPINPPTIWVTDKDEDGVPFTRKEVVDVKRFFITVGGKF
jgi:hypothetical protein